MKGRPLTLLERLLLFAFLLTGLGVSVGISAWLFCAGWKLNDGRVTPLLYIAGAFFVVPAVGVVYVWDLERRP